MLRFWKSKTEATPGKRPHVLLVGGPNSYYIAGHLPRLLRSAGCRVDVLAPAGDVLHYSRFVAAYTRAPAALGPLIDFVAAHLEDHRYDLVVFGVDDVLESIAARSPRAPWLTWLRPDVADAVTSRTRFAAWAGARGIAMPPGIVCRSPDEAMAWIAEQGPSMIKTNHTGGGAGVRLVGRPGDLPPLWRELGSPETFQVQKFIDGPAGVTEMVLRRGEILAWFSSAKERTWKPFGSSIMRRFRTPAGMAELVDTVARATAFHGLCGFDWVEDAATGRPFLIEFHPRAPSGFRCGGYAGVDIVAAIADLFTAAPAVTRRPGSPGDPGLAPVCCYFPHHLAYAILKHPGDLRYWLPGSGAVAWRLASLDDPLLLGGALWKMAVRAAGKRFHRRTRPSAAPPAFSNPA